MRSVNFFILICAVLSLGFVGCSNNDKAMEKPASLNFAVLKGPSGLGFAPLLTNAVEFSSDFPITVSVEASPDMVVPLLVKGELSGAVLPTNLAAKLYQKTNDLVLVGISGNNMLSLVTVDSSIKSLKDLEGKKITVAGSGSTPEYVLKSVLQNAGVDLEKVEFDFSLAPSEIVPAMMAGVVSTCFIPEPFVTMALTKVENSIIPFSIQDSWANISGNHETFPMTVIVFTKHFAQAYPEAVYDFFNDYKKSVKFLLSDVKRGAELVEKADIGLKADVAEKAIPNCQLVAIPAEKAKSYVSELLEAFLKYSPESIGGVLPADDFYFKK